MTNIILQIISMVLCIVGVFQVIVVPKRWNTNYKYNLRFLAILFFYSASVLTSLMLSGKEGDAVHIVLSVSVFLEFLFAYTMTAHVISWLLARILNDETCRQVRINRIITLLLLGVQTTLLIVSQFTDFYYTIDSANIYHRQSGIAVHIALWAAEYFYAIYLLVRYHSQIKRRSSLIAFSLFALFFGVALIMQLLFPGIYFVTLASSFSVVVLFAFVASDNAQEYHRKEREIEKLRVNVMLSQIQPHFLYNSLTTIKHLCRVDPAKAEKAVTDFSVYIRGNMDSLTAEKPIRFIDELDHTRAYLSMEKLRFGDDLDIDEQIPFTDFKIPSLTLQPLVENAVRHGIRRTEDGTGTVTIITEDHPDHIEVIVRDDGRGFDTGILDIDDDNHLGIRNVRYRLEHMSGAKLTVRSVIDEGTEAVISIPKTEMV